MNGNPESEPLRLFDAHLHLQDPRLKNYTSGKELETGVILAQVCNGTHPDDWPAIAAMDGDVVRKAYGVHPWKCEELPKDWEKTLIRFLRSGAVSVGEIGLDRWIEPRNEEVQMEVFTRQLQIASDLALPPTIHCLRAWGLLVDALHSAKLESGFLVHGFGGSKDTLYQLLDLGGYVSFSAYAADPGRKRMRDVIRACPVDRLLVETDAPDMVPPENVCHYPVKDSEGRIHHPAEIETAYAFIANCRGMELGELVPVVERNFKQLFQSG